MPRPLGGMIYFKFIKKFANPQQKQTVNETKNLFDNQYTDGGHCGRNNRTENRILDTVLKK
jgi:hypothetical protein